MGGVGGPQKEDSGQEGAPPNEMAEAAAGWARYAAWTSSRAMQAAQDAADLSSKSMASAKQAQEKIAKLMGNPELKGENVKTLGFGLETGPGLLSVASGVYASTHPHFAHALKGQRLTSR